MLISSNSCIQKEWEYYIFKRCTCESVIISLDSLVLVLDKQTHKKSVLSGLQYLMILLPFSYGPIIKNSSLLFETYNTTSNIFYNY